VEGRAELALQPLDAGPVDVAAVELGDLRLGGEVAQHLAGARAEVEHPFALEGPAVGQQLEHELPGVAAETLVRGERVGLVRHPHTEGQLDGRER
jgi:hypothetical protein